MHHFAALLLASLCLLSVDAQSQKSEVFATGDGAISGYDPVAYFTEKKPVKGKPELKYDWRGQTWYFSTQKNLTVFSAAPENFAPQFGGYCAYGMSRGYKAKTEPDAWSIVDGKLYLNYNKDVRETWNTQQAAFIQKANANWPGVKNRE